MIVLLFAGVLLTAFAQASNADATYDEFALMQHPTRTIHREASKDYLQSTEGPSPTRARHKLLRLIEESIAEIAGDRVKTTSNVLAQGFRVTLRHISVYWGLFSLVTVSDCLWLSRFLKPFSAVRVAIYGFKGPVAFLLVLLLRDIALESAAFAAVLKFIPPLLLWTVALVMFSEWWGEQPESSKSWHDSLPFWQFAFIVLCFEADDFSLGVELMAVEGAPPLEVCVGWMLAGLSILALSVGVAFNRTLMAYVEMVPMFVIVCSFAMYSTLRLVE